MFSQCISMVLVACYYPALQCTYACARQQTVLFLVTHPSSVYLANSIKCIGDSLSCLFMHTLYYALLTSVRHKYVYALVCCSYELPSVSWVHEIIYLDFIASEWFLSSCFLVTLGCAWISSSKFIQPSILSHIANCAHLVVNSLDTTLSDRDSQSWYLCEIDGLWDAKYVVML